MIIESKKDFEKLIPLRQISKIGPYSSAYLSNLVQRKKLKAKKVGRNYYTSLKWFKEYLDSHARDDKKEVEAVSQAEVVIKNTKEAQIDLEALSQLIADKIAPDKGNALKSQKGKKNKDDKPSWIKKNYKKLIPKNLYARLALVALLVIVFFSGAGILFPKAIWHFSNLLEAGYRLPIIEMKKSFTASLSFTPRMNRENFSGEVFGQVAGVSEWSEETRLRTEAKDAYVFFKNGALNLGGMIGSGVENIYLAFSDFFYPSNNYQADKNSDTDISKQEVKVSDEGAVVIPLNENQDPEEIKQRIENMFSDPVVINSDETERAGIIRPVFGSGPEAQEYFYMMVPVTED